MTALTSEAFSGVASIPVDPVVVSVWPPVSMVCTYLSGSANETPLVAASVFAAAVALPLVTWTTTMSPRFSALAPIFCRADEVSVCAVADESPPNSGWIDVAPSRDSVVLTTALDVFGATIVLSARSLLPVTDVPDSTAITVPGTTPVFSDGFTSFGSTDPAACPDGCCVGFAAADAEAGIACPAASASAVTAIADIAASRLRCIQSVALINFLLARGFACSRLLHDTAQHCRYALLRAIKLNDG